MIVGRSNLVRDSRNGGQKRYSAEKPSICKPPEAPECENSGASKFRYFEGKFSFRPVLNSRGIAQLGGRVVHKAMQKSKLQAKNLSWQKSCEK